jgi:HEAT repeat protein
LVKPSVQRRKRKGDVAGLVDALSYRRNYRVRMEAARALGELGSEEGTQALISALSNMREFAEVRWQALHSLAQIKGKKTLEALASLAVTQPWTAPVATEALGKLQAVELLVQLFGTGPREVRKWV